MKIKLAYTVTEAVQATGLSEWTIRGAIGAGHLKARRKPYPDGKPNENGMYLILVDDLQSWLAEMPAA